MGTTIKKEEVDFINAHIPGNWTLVNKKQIASQPVASLDHISELQEIVRTTLQLSSEINIEKGGFRLYVTKPPSECRVRFSETRGELMYSINEAPNALDRTKKRTGATSEGDRHKHSYSLKPYSFSRLVGKDHLEEGTLSIAFNQAITKALSSYKLSKRQSANFKSLASEAFYRALTETTQQVKNGDYGQDQAIISLAGLIFDHMIESEERPEEENGAQLTDSEKKFVGKIMHRVLTSLDYNRVISSYMESIIPIQKTTPAPIMTSLTQSPGG